MAYMYRDGSTWRVVIYKEGVRKDINLGRDWSQAKLLKSSIELSSQDQKFKKQLLATLIELGLIDPQTGEAKTTAKVNWQQAVTQILGHLQKIGRAANTVDHARRSLKSLEASIQPEYPSDVTPAKADEWIQHLTTATKIIKGELVKRYKPSGVSMYVRSASSCFGRFVRWGFVEKNPFSQCDKPKVEQTIPNPFQKDDLEKLLAVSSPVLKRTIKILVESGMRTDEFFHLKWKNLTLGSTPSIHIKRDGNWIPKAHQERIIPCSRELVKSLGKAGDTEESVAGKNQAGEPLDKDWLEKAFKRAIKRAGLVSQGYTPNCCRDTYATNLALQGYQAHDISARLGHRNLITSMRYVSLARLLQDAKRLNKKGQ